MSVGSSMLQTDDQELAAKQRIMPLKHAERARQAFLSTPVGRARTAFEREDHLFQYAADVESQEDVIVSMVGSQTQRTSSDPTDILNAVVREGWELVNGSFVFRERGQQSRDKSSRRAERGDLGHDGGYYLFFRRCEASRQA